MKKLALILALALCCPVLGAWAEPEATPTPLESSAGNFWDSLGRTWGAFVDLAGEAGSAVSGWVDGASKDVKQFIDQNMPELGMWIDDVGQFFDENVSPEVTAAWDVLVESASEITTHTQAEIERAYAEIQAWMSTSNASPEVRQAVDNVAEAAGIDDSEADPLSAASLKAHYFDPVCAVHPGTAGSSLAEAQAVCAVLRFAYSHRLASVDAEVLRGRLLAAWEELDDDGRAAFSESFPGVSALADSCFADWQGNRALFDDAGVAGEMDALTDSLSCRDAWEKLRDATPAAQAE